MGVAVLRLAVTRYTPSQDPARHLAPTTRRSLAYVLVASMLGAIGTVALVMAVLYPVTTGGTLALATGGLVAARQLRRFRRRRRHAGRARTVCLPKLGVCVTV